MELTDIILRDYYTNLLDAGCDEITAEKCIELLQENKRVEMFKIIDIVRRRLLDNMHVSQKQIDCLDYFVYKINKDN